MGLAAFNRMRREQAEREAKEAAESEKVTDKLSVNVVDGLSVDEVKEYLTQAGVKFSHNTGLDKLKEKLKQAL